MVQQFEPVLNRTELKELSSEEFSPVRFSSGNFFNGSVQFGPKRRVNWTELNFGNTMLEMRFNLEEQKRERLVFGPAFLEEESVSEEKKAADKAAVEQLSLQEGEGKDLMPRTHPADVNNDVKSLDRRGKRNLYLLLLTLQRLAIRKTEKMYGNFLKVI